MWRRALAFLIDWGLLIIVTAVEDVAGIAQNDLVGLLNLFLIIAYFAGMEYRFGATLGKRIVGLRVSQEPSPDLFLPLVKRAFIRVLCLFPPLTAAYGLTAIWRSDGRSFADFASDSIVVEASTSAPPERLSYFGRILASILIILSPWIAITVIMVVSFGWLTLENWDELSPYLKLFIFGNGQSE